MNGNFANRTETPPEPRGSGERDVVESVGPVGVRYGARTASGWMSEFRNQNTFGLRRFVSHGVFWIVLAVLNMFAKRFSVAPERLAEAQDWFLLC